MIILILIIPLRHSNTASPNLKRYYKTKIRTELRNRFDNLQLRFENVSEKLTESTTQLSALNLANEKLLALETQVQSDANLISSLNTNLTANESSSTLQQQLAVATTQLDNLTCKSEQKNPK